MAARADGPAQLTEAVTQSGNREASAQDRCAISVVHSPMLPPLRVARARQPDHQPARTAIFINIRINMRFVIYITAQNKKE